jgi:hypothetical protein
MPINPVQFAHNVCDEFLRYIFSAFPISDPQLAEQARRLLERPSSLDIPLVQGPFVSLSEAFAKGEPVQQMASKGLLHPAMPGLIGYRIGVGSSHEGPKGNAWRIVLLHAACVRCLYWQEGLHRDVR